MARFGFLVRSCISFSILGVLIVSCGDSANFGGGAPNSDSANVTRSTPPAAAEKKNAESEPDVAEGKTYQTMTWLWQCQNTPQPLPKPSSDGDVVVSGKGPFEFDERSLRGTKVTFSGHLCPPETQPRDIVFVTDTSASMVDNDPRTGDTCGRLQAIQALIAATPAGTARFGLVTFNTEVAAQSTTLYDSAQSLFAAVAPTGNIADVVCLQEGSTNYNSALTRAGQLLAAGRPGASKELYFVSDGQPNGGQDGVAVADSLKKNGVSVGGRNIPVTIGAIMLKGADTVLQQYIASLDPQGKPIYAFAGQAQDLAKILTQLANNTIVSATLKYRFLGESTFTTVNVFDHLQGLDFTLPPMTIPAKDGLPGLEVIYEYIDKLGQKFTSSGRLILKVTAKSED